MIKAVIFDMFETLVTMYESETYTGRNICNDMGIKTGLLTNCFFEERDVIIKSPLYEFFDVVCMSCELGLMKPEKEVFRICMDKLGVSPEECVYVGDGGSRELETAENLGMRPLQAVWYLKEGTHQPVGILDDFEHAQTPIDVCRVCFLSTL